MASLHPMPGYVLVELTGKYKHVSAEVKTYEAATTGVVIDSEEPEMVGRRVYWTDLVAPTPIAHDGTNYAFIKIDRIEGYEVE